MILFVLRNFLLLFFFSLYRAFLMALTFFLRLSLSADEDDADHEDKQRHNGGCDHGHDDDDVRIPNALQEPDA